MTALSRTATPLLAAAAIATALAGCGSDDGGTPSADAPAATQPAGTGVASAEPNASASPGKVDAAFIREMLPHHALAIDMAKIALDRSDRVVIKSFSKGIIRKQSAETTQLQDAAKRLKVDVGTGMVSDATMKADSETLGLSMTSMGMSMSAASLKTANPVDKAYLAEMLPHHRGAIAMAKSEVIHGGDKALKKIAQVIIIGQQTEVAEMVRWQQEWYPTKSTSKSK